MAKLLFVRIAGALGITSLALFFLGLNPFLSAEPTSGAGLLGRTATYTVNREFKGDRLPLPSDINSAVSRNEFRSQRRPQASGEIPVGCDPAFSPVSSPSMAYYYGRCAT
jgi:hypothetical protein